MAAATETSGESMELSDFTEFYLTLCKRDNLAPIAPLHSLLLKHIDLGSVPTEFHLKGNSPDLSKSRISNAHITLLAASLGYAPFLQHLDLSYNQISDEGAILLADVLKETSALRVLNLSWNNIGREGGVAIAKTLTVNERLQALNLSGNSIENEGGVQFAAALQVNKTLSTLTLASCHMKSAAIIALAIVLQTHDSLMDLDISDNMSSTNRLSQSLDRDIMIHVARALRGTTSLKRLGLRKMGISDEVCAHYIAPAIKLAIGQLAVLDLSANRISRDGGVALCQAIYKNMSIVSLNLSCCNIQNEGAEAVCVTLMHNKSLREIYLDHNGIQGRGLRDIAHALIERNTTLQKLSLWGNSWDAASCEAFSHLLGGPARTIKIGDSEHDNAHHNPSENSLNCRLHRDNVDFVIYMVDGSLQVAHNASFSYGSKTTNT